MGTVTLLLAVWGAFIGTVNLLWNIRRDLRDRGRLHVLCYIGQTRGGSAGEDARRRLVYHVTNTGRRPIVVTHLGGAWSPKQHFLIPTAIPLPRTLQAGDFLLEYTDDLSMLSPPPQALWAIDSLQRHWKIPRRQLRQILREAAHPPGVEEPSLPPPRGGPRFILGPDPPPASGGAQSCRSSFSTS